MPAITTTCRLAFARPVFIRAVFMRFAFGWRPLLTLLVVAMSLAPARANDDWYDGLDRATRDAIQDVLIWSGDYAGMIDGDIGRNTRAAVAALQRRMGTKADGLLTTPEFEAAANGREKLKTTFEWTWGHDAVAGIGVSLPYALARWSEGMEDGAYYRNEEGAFRVRTFRITDFDPARALPFARSLNAELPAFREAYARATRDWLVLTGQDATEKFYMRALMRGQEVRGFFVWYDTDRESEYDRLVVAMANSLAWGDVERPTPNPKVAEADPRSPLLPEAAPGSGFVPEDDIKGSGTAFLLRTDGVMATNAHVVDGCGRVVVRGLGDARVIESDALSDVAVLSVPGAAGRPTATLADDEPLLAEPVYAFGFPLPGQLGDGIGFSAGNVSALVGMNAANHEFRMTAAVQPGNSGGPLLDEAGRVVGIVTSKMNAVKVADATGDIPQSMNFAVRTSVLRRMLDRLELDVPVRPRANEQARLTDIAKAATDYTFQVLCRDR